MATDPLAELPVLYATALRLEAAGASRGLIAAGLGVPEAAVTGLLTIAHRKLDRIRGTVAEPR